MHGSFKIDLLSNVLYISVEIMYGNAVTSLLLHFYWGQCVDRPIAHGHSVIIFTVIFIKTPVVAANGLRDGGKNIYTCRRAERVVKNLEKISIAAAATLAEGSGDDFG